MSVTYTACIQRTERVKQESTAGIEQYFFVLVFSFFQKENDNLPVIPILFF